MSRICRKYHFIKIPETQNCQNIYLNSSADKVSGILIIQNPIDYKFAVLRDFN
jgi:hypothetical protein